MNAPTTAEQPKRAGVTWAGSASADREQRAAELVSLIQSVAEGQEHALAELYEQTSGWVYHVIHRVTRSRELAEDVTQDVYIQIWRQASNYSPARGSVLSWMTMIGHRRAVDRVRREVNDADRARRYADHNADRDIDHVWDRVEHHLDADHLHRGLAKMTDILREALILVYFGGHTHREVAQLLNLPLGTAKTRVRNGLISLEHTLKVIG